MKPDPFYTRGQFARSRRPRSLRFVGRRRRCRARTQAPDGAPSRASPASGRAFGRGRNRRRQARLPQPSLAVLARLRPARRRAGVPRLVSRRGARRRHFRRRVRTRAAPAKPPGNRSLDDLPGPQVLPLVGNLHQLDRPGSISFFRAGPNNTVPMFRFLVGGAKLVAISDSAHDQRDAASTAGDVSVAARISTAVISEVGIKGVFNAEGDAWRSQRKLSVAALAQRHLQQLYPHASRPSPPSAEEALGPSRRGRGAA